jgi:hypothetical protein
MPLSKINSNSFSTSANTTLGGASASLSRLTVLNTTSSNVSAAAGSRGPIASFRGGNDNNRFDVQVDNSGPRCNVSLSAWNVAGAASQMIFNAGATGASEAMRIDTGGVVVLTNGQIAFPATANPSTDANTLDDYEEGSWTPNLRNNGGTATFSSVVGRYRKIGSVVYCWFTCGGSGNSGGGGGAIILSGLPFNMSLGNQGISTWGFTMSGGSNNAAGMDVITSQGNVGTDAQLNYNSGNQEQNTLTNVTGTFMYPTTQ